MHSHRTTFCTSSHFALSEVKFLDQRGMNYCESIYQRCFPYNTDQGIRGAAMLPYVRETEMFSNYTSCDKEGP